MGEGPRLTRGQLQQRAASGAAWTVLHTALSLPAAFVVNIVLARVLGPAGFGRLAYLTAVMSIATLIVSAGISSGLIQFGSKAHARGDRGRVQALLSRSQGFRVLWAAPLLTLIVVLLGEGRPALLVGAVVFGVWVPAAVGGATACLTIENRTAAGAKLAIVMNVVTQAAVLLSLYSMGTPDGVWLTRLVVSGMAPLLAIPIIAPIYRRAVLRIRAPWRLPREFWRYALPAGASGVVAGLALDRTEVILLEQLSTAQQVGMYALAFGLAGHAFAPAQSLLTPLVPAVSGLREVDGEAVGRAFLRVLRTSSTIIGAIIAVGAPVLAILVPVIYGAEYTAASNLVFVLTATAGLTVVTFPMISFVSSRLRGMSVLRLNLLALGAMGALALLTVPVLGAWGAVLAKASVGLVRFGWLLLTEKESFETPTRASLRASSPMWLGMAAAVASYLGTTLVALGPGLQALIALPVSVLTFAIGLWVSRTGLTPADAGIVSSIGPKAVRRVTTPLARCLAWAR
nr:lipopolysaccharide biosynthesis protein [Janibacter cremeus]